jgi:VanZ family protein
MSASTILGFYSAHGAKQLLVGQYYGNGLLITRDPEVESDETGTIEVDVAHIFRPGVRVLISISSGPTGTTVFADGTQRSRFPKFTISRDEILGQIVIGNSPVGYDPWRGELRGLAIYANDLTASDALKHFRQWSEPKETIPDLRNAIAGYSFLEGEGSEVRNEVAFAPDLYIPTIFSVPHKNFLQSPAKEFEPTRSYLTDVLTNIAGFVPLGLILCAYFTWTQDRWKSIVTAAIACGMLSLLIEILQYYIPPRGSGMTDVITNTLGGAIGASFMQFGVVRNALRRLKIIPLYAWQEWGHSPH